MISGQGGHEPVHCQDGWTTCVGFESGEVLFYLKKKITMLPEGALIQPHGTYIPKLLNLLKV